MIYRTRKEGVFIEVDDYVGDFLEFYDIVPEIHYRTGYAVLRAREFGQSRQLQLHRLIFKRWGSGFDPEKEVDHVNGNRLDNRLCNLRLVSHAENMRNTHKTRWRRDTKQALIADKCIDKSFAWCCRCETFLPPDCFYPCSLKNGADYATYCMVCIKQYQKTLRGKPTNKSS